jgi:hypothetical protein
MRTRRAQAALTVAAAGFVAVVAGLAVVVADPAQAAPTPGLTLDPASGRSGGSITATFVVDERFAGKCDHLRVTFRWDNHEVGQDRGSGCQASITFKPPKDRRAPGPHHVTAVDSTTHQLGAAIFMITTEDETPTPTPTRSRGVQPTMSGSDGSSDPAAGVDPGSPPVTPASPVGGAVPKVAATSSPLTIWALILGGALVLGGGAILGLVVWRTRRDEPDAGPKFTQ